MNYSFEYIDIILLAMIAGFIFLRLRGILGKKTGFEDEIKSNFHQETVDANDASLEKNLNSETFDEKAKKEFLKGAQIAYETIVTNFSKGKLKDIKSLLDLNVYEQFNSALDERRSKNYSSETTFVGINSAEIKDHKQNKNMLEVTVEFVSEIISSVQDKDKKWYEMEKKKGSITFFPAFTSHRVKPVTKGKRYVLQELFTGDHFV